MPKSTDALDKAIRRVLWPFLEDVGFSKVTARKFARERFDVFQQLWVDANGAAKAKSTRIVLCTTFPFGRVNGYMDPHGFIICRGRHWDMSTADLADSAMEQVVTALRASELRSLDELSDIDHMLETIKALQGSPAQKQWYPTHAALHQLWKNGDPGVMQFVSNNRKALKL